MNGNSAFLAVGLILWLIGGNIIVALHYKRKGKNMASGFKPFAFPFKDFNKREWIETGILSIISLALFSVGI